MEFKLLDSTVINLSSSDDKEHVQRVVEHYKNHLDSIEQNVHKNQPLLNAICAGLQACDEVIRLRSQLEQYGYPHHSRIDNPSIDENNSRAIPSTSPTVNTGSIDNIDSATAGLINSIDSIISDNRDAAP